MRNPTIIRIWLALVAGLTLVMVLVGGVTRLTDSGLSMTDWKPILGTVPPQTPADWDARFAQYQASPQFEKVNSEMKMEAFKFIFFWEWFHRVLGRVVGLVALLPWLLFAGLRWIRGRWAGWLFLVPLLVLLQGLMGWFMVKSGLVDIPRVSPFRLSAHLGLALLLFCYCLWWMCRVTKPRVAAGDRRSALAAWILVAVLALQGFFGALVAGYDAGIVSTSWPKMMGKWIPSFDQGLPVVVHFTHRTFAWIVVGVALGVLFLAWKRSQLIRQKAPLVLIVLLLCLQIVLGVLTVIQGLPLHMASAHQVNAALLLGASVVAASELGR